MNKRFVAIWFRHLKTDWMIHHQPALKDTPFVLALPDHGRLKITEVSAIAKAKGISEGMLLADAKVILPAVEAMDDQQDLSEKLLRKLGAWCIRYTPLVAIDVPDGLVLDITGCAHLWGSEQRYLGSLTARLKEMGYHIRAAMADTIGAAWAIARYGKTKAIIPAGKQAEALQCLPPAALRLETTVLERLHKLGLYTIDSFMHLQRSVLRRRFGEAFLLKLHQALGSEEEIIEAILPAKIYEERLPCIEPIQTRTGIEIALKKLLEKLCTHLHNNGKGIRTAELKCYRIDDKIETVSIHTNHASENAEHLFKLFDPRIGNIEPALGIELFVLHASKVEDNNPLQETLWTAGSNLESREIAELIDNLQNKFGDDIVHRYLPVEHHIPERLIKPANSLKEKPAIPWRSDKLRPVQLLPEPQLIEVTAPIPDYPPMNFRYQGKLHVAKKADACERIEAEWWIEPGLHRDYYIVEDEAGCRYWLFRLGHYDEEKKPMWFLHGLFA